MNNQELKIQKQNAIDAYNGADANGKAMLTKLFPNVVLTGKITDYIKTFADARALINPDADLSALIDYSGNDPLMISAQAYAKMAIIAAALNEGWQPDWSNRNQIKWVPWFEHKSGFGLSLNGVAYWDAYTCCGSRLCYKTKELAHYAATQFADIYNDFLTIK